MIATPPSRGVEPGAGIGFAPEFAMTSRLKANLMTAHVSWMDDAGSGNRQ